MFVKFKHFVITNVGWKNEHKIIYLHKFEVSYNVAYKGYTNNFLPHLVEEGTLKWLGNKIGHHILGEVVSNPTQKWVRNMYIR